MRISIYHWHNWTVTAEQFLLCCTFSTLSVSNLAALRKVPTSRCLSFDVTLQFFGPVRDIFLILMPSFPSASNKVLSFYNKDTRGQLQTVSFDSDPVKKIFHGSFHKVSVIKTNLVKALNNDFLITTTRLKKSPPTPFHDVVHKKMSRQLQLSLDVP